MLTSQTLRAWRTVHTWSSLACTVFLLVLCLTGLPLIFGDEITGWLSHAPPYPAAPAGVHAGLDRLIGEAKVAAPGEVVRGIFLDDDAPQATVITAPNRDGPPRPPHRITFDFRTGALRQDLAKTGGPAVVAWLLRLHSSLLVGLPGSLLLSAMGVLFLAAVVSGVVLYAPFMRKLEFGTVRRSGSARLAWLDLHNMIGVVVLVWTLVVGATGVMNTLANPLFGIWQATDVARLLKPYARPIPVTATASVDGAVQTALAAVPGSVVQSVVFPANFASSPQHFVLWLKGRRTLTSRLMTPVLVDARSGQLALVVAMPWYLRALEVSRPLHFGDYGGEALKLLWAALDLLTIAVLVSGLYLWLAKRQKAIGAAKPETYLSIGEEA